MRARRKLSETNLCLPRKQIERVGDIIDEVETVLRHDGDPK
jgi:hypothetical protein